jgi:hypothetical protein
MPSTIEAVEHFIEGICQGVFPSKYSKPCLEANSEIRPRLTFFSSITSGNVAQYAAEKAMFLGAKVVTLSDSNGTVYLKNGFTAKDCPRALSISSAK